MTILAGIFCRGTSDLKEEAVAELSGLLCRSDGIPIETRRTERFLLVKADIGAFRQPTPIFSDRDQLCALVGKALIDEGGDQPDLTRLQELQRLQQELGSNAGSLLRSCRGVFAAVRYDRRTDTLTVLTDRLGIRPIYWWANKEYFVFASALRILERFSLVPKQVDVTGLTELTCFGYPLERRTPYRAIQRLYAAELLSVSRCFVTSECYWRWDTIPTTERPLASIRSELYTAFKDAVRIRLGSDTSTVAYLSGGLDSRCIVAQLLGLQARVRTFNFSPANAQDQIFARLFAEQAGVDHREVTQQRSNPNWSILMSDALASTAWRDEPVPERPQLVWSGDGGSVGIGHVYMYPEVVGLLRNGQTDHAITTFLEQQGARVVQSLFRRQIRHSLSRIPLVGIRGELPASQTLDPARGFHLFLLHNDQRRHLDHHFETIDVHRLEFQLPFFDSEVLKCLLSVPLDECLNHRLYSDWLAEFPRVTRSSPWQTYPGHVTCPLSTTEYSTYQWGARQTALYEATERTELLRKGWRLLFSPSLATSLLSRTGLALATVAFQLGLRDYGYVLRIAGTFQKYCESSQRAVSLKETATNLLGE